MNGHGRENVKPKWKTRGKQYLLPVSPSPDGTYPPPIPAPPVEWGEGDLIPPDPSEAGESAPSLAGEPMPLGEVVPLKLPALCCSSITEGSMRAGLSLEELVITSEKLLNFWKILYN